MSREPSPPPTSHPPAPVSTLGLPFWLNSCGLLLRSLRPDDLGPRELPVVEEEDEGEAEEELETVVLEAPEEKWDCETIISEYIGPLHVTPTLRRFAELRSAMLSSAKYFFILLN